MSTNHSNLVFDEARYQTIGRGHGFIEISGVPFKIAEKYSHLCQASGSTLVHELSNLSLFDSRSLSEANMYSFELERKVLENMEPNTRQHR